VPLNGNKQKTQSTNSKAKQIFQNPWIPTPTETKTTKMTHMADERIMLSLLKTLKSIETKLETLNKNIENANASSKKTEKDTF